jgi:integrase
VKNMLPAIGDIPLAELHRRDINRVLTAIQSRGSRVEAARVFEDVRAFLRWARARGDLDANPTEGMRKPQTPGPRERVLSEDEIRTLWRSLPEALPRSSTVRSIIMLCLLTGQRAGEVAGITAAELDAKQRLWTIPSSRSKNKHAHTVPLTDLGLALAEAIAAKPKLPSHAIAKIVRRAQPHFGIAQWTTHDLRRTVVTKMAELGVAPIVLGHVINHRSVTKAGVTLSVYSQHTYEGEKRQALELWADQLDAIVQGGAKVLPLGRARSG